MVAQEHPSRNLPDFISDADGDPLFRRAGLVGRRGNEIHLLRTILDVKDNDQLGVFPTVIAAILRSRAVIPFFIATCPKHSPDQ
jgi:hypothetical protein